MSRVELDLEAGEVQVYLEHKKTASWPCPECGQACPLHDHQPQPIWRHLDTCQYQTLLQAELPRTGCREHGVRVVEIPWAQPHGRFTALSIEGLARGIWEPYVNSTKTYLPQADEKIVFDKFHVAKHLGEGVDKVRRQENKQLRQVGDHRLLGTKYDWLKGRDKFKQKGWRAFCRLRRGNLKTSRAWAMREQAMKLWDYSYRGAAENHFRWWYRWATHSRLKPMIDKAKLLKKHLQNILTYLTHPITNALSESLNSKIQWVKYTARGFRNLDNFKTAIYFHCGGLDLLPAT